MRLLEGIARIGGGARDEDDGETVADVDAFVDRLDAVASEHGVTVQAFDARYVVSRRHLERAVDLADRERGRGEGIARDRAVEVLLYAAGRRQINRALEMGVEAGETPVVVLVDDDPEVTGRDDDADAAADEAAAVDAVAALLDPAETLGAYDDERVCTFFDVGQAERDATDRGLEALVLERVALLVVER